MSIESHRLAQATFIESPNQSERPAEALISLMVIHNISLPPGEFGGDSILRLFCNTLDCSTHPYFHALEGLRVSAHLLIRRNGDVIQFVPFNRKAWHAGKSSFEDREDCNDFSIGVELEGTDRDPFSDRQYMALTDITLDLLATYSSLTAARIVGHSDIAPGRKSDPGPCFDWERYKRSLSAQNTTR